MIAIAASRAPRRYEIVVYFVGGFAGAGFTGAGAGDGFTGAGAGLMGAGDGRIGAGAGFDAVGAGFGPVEELGEPDVPDTVLLLFAFGELRFPPVVVAAGFSLVSALSCSVTASSQAICGPFEVFSPERA